MEAWRHKKILRRFLHLQTAADAAMDSGDYRGAARLFRNARSVAIEGRDERAAAVCDLGLGSVFESMGQYPEATTAYQAARTYLWDNGFEQGIADCDNGMGNVFAKTGRYQDAITAYQTARTYFQQNRSLAEVAACDHNLANVYADTGRYVDAITAHLASRTYYQENLLLEYVAACDKDLGTAYLVAGRYPEAVTVLEAARAYYQQNRLPEMVAGCDKNLGVVYVKMARYPEAITACKAARAYYQQHGHPERGAGCDLNLGAVYMQMDQYPEAMTAYQAARTYYQRHRLREKAARCDHNLAVVYGNQAEAAGAGGDHGERDRRLHVALELCVPAALFVDAVRFTLTDTAARRDWTLNIAQPFMQLAFALATRAGDSDLLADLITAARTTGIFTHHGSVPKASFGPDRAVADDLLSPRIFDAVLPDPGGQDPGTVRRSDATMPPVPPGPASSLAGEAAKILGAEGFKLNPSPFTRNPGGRLALAEPVARASSRYGIPLTELRTPKTITLT